LLGIRVGIPIVPWSISAWPSIGYRGFFIIEFVLEAIAATLPAVVLLVWHAREPRRKTIWSEVYVLWAIFELIWIVVASAAGTPLFQQEAVLSESYYVIAHYRYVTHAAATLTLFAGVYFWLPRLSGYLPSGLLSRVHFWLVAVGMSLAFLPIVVLSIVGMPRRYADYPDTFAGWNYVSSVGAFIAGLGIAVFIVMLIETFWRRQPVTL